MKIAVLGLWHLGSVTAACLAAVGHTVTAFDHDQSTIDRITAGDMPVAEPGLAELVAAGQQSGRLRFSADRASAVGSADIVWIAFDTPVDDDDIADVDGVLRNVEATFAELPDNVVVISSSQLPVGSVRKLEESWSLAAGARTASFACVPENLRLGKAIEAFNHPDRVVVGVRDAWARQRIEEAWAPITTRLEWMSVESAEMTKHAVNAFLATSVTFINELASLCERVGADAQEVERGLKTEMRIGARAYVSPGGAYAGGTLARDVTFLRTLGAELASPTPLMDGVALSNDAHKRWIQRRLEMTLPAFHGAKIAIWGLTYKPGTDTLRRSSAVELCHWLSNRGVHVHVHDPAVRELPTDLVVTRHTDPLDAASGADILVIATAWPEYRRINVDELATRAPGLVVLDANRFLGPLLGADPRFRVVGVGQPQ
jgi:nucleotide sugar dehydrogenase